MSRKSQVESRKLRVKAAILRAALALGGPGSGNWAHMGRPGQVGGSAPRSSGMTIAKGKDWLERYERTAGRKHPLAEQIEKERQGSLKQKAQVTVKKRIAELDQQRAKLQRGIDERNAKLTDIQKQRRALKRDFRKQKITEKDYFNQSDELYKREHAIGWEISQMKQEVEVLSTRVSLIQDLLKGPRPSGAAAAKVVRGQLGKIAKKYGDTEDLERNIAALAAERSTLQVKFARAKWGTQAWDDLDRAVKDKSDELFKLQARRIVARENVHTEALAVLSVDKPIRVDLRWGSKFSDSDPRKKAVTEGVRIFRNLVSEQPDVVSHVIVRKGGKGRSTAGVNEPVINITTHAGVRTVIHEMGHWLENSSTWIKRRVYDFYERRTQGESTTSMNRAAQTTGYRGNEKTRVDKFINPYMGKNYTSGGKRYATEILSMGLEMFYDDPMKLARQDPEYFDFIFSVVRGME